MRQKSPILNCNNSIIYKICHTANVNAAATAATAANDDCDDICDISSAWNSWFLQFFASENQTALPNLKNPTTKCPVDEFSESKSGELISTAFSIEY